MRAALVGAALLTLTLAGHTAAGGALDLMGTALVVTLALAFGSATARIRLPLIPLLALLAAGQVMLHLILAVAGSHAHGSAAPVAETSTMLLAHALATVGAAAAILGVDGLVERWLVLLRSALGWALHLAPVPVAHPAGALADHDTPTTLLVLRHGVIRRGPPRPRALALA